MRAEATATSAGARMASGGHSRRSGIADCSFLLVVVLSSAALYVWRLGFYSDDWFHVAVRAQAVDQSLLGLLKSVGYSAGRPVQFLYLTALYWLFGQEALGYHVVNLLVSACSVLLFYDCLRRLRAPRLAAVAVPLIYASLPQYSTDRVWISVNQANLAMALYFLSLDAGLRSLKRFDLKSLFWGGLSVSALVASTLAYEIVLPLFAGNLGLLWWAGRRAHGEGSSKKGRIVLLVATAAAIAGSLLFKAAVRDRPVLEGGHAARLIFVARNVMSINFWGPKGFGLGMPGIVARILRDHFDAASFVLALILCLLAAVYLRRIEQRSSLGNAASWGLLTAVGFAFVALGYSLAVVTKEIGFVTTGIVNRTAIAASVGIAAAWSGGVGVVAGLMPRRVARLFFSGCVAALCGAGLLINTTVANSWTAASGRQARVLHDLKERAPTLPPGSTVLLAGVCPYIGPAIVFEAHWDMGGALQLAYRDPTLRGDVATSRMTVGETDVSTYIYDREVDKSAEGNVLIHCCQHYRYGENLFVFETQTGRLIPLPDAMTARSYFQAARAQQPGGCRGREGIGAPLF